MKIAIISMIREPWGGSEELWASMAEQAMKEGDTIIHSTYIFRHTAPKEEALIRQGLIHIGRDGFIEPGTPAPVRIMRKALLRFKHLFRNPFHAIFALKPDLVIYNGTCYSIVEEHYLLKALHNNHTPYWIVGQLSSEDGNEITDQQASKLKDIYAKAGQVIFVSQRGLDNARKRAGSAIPNGVVLRNPVNMSSLEKVEYPALAETQLAMVGNLRIVHKGQNIVLDFLQKQTWKERPWHLNIYGSGEDEDLLRALVARHQLQDRVSFHGRVRDIRKLWEVNHILLMPSLMEGMPLAVVEAMICGRPCVVTDVGGHAEWIEEGKQGWIAPTPAGFEGSVEKAWQSRSSWKQIGEQARERALQLFDPHPGKTLLNLIKKRQ